MEPFSDVSKLYCHAGFVFHTYLLVFLQEHSNLLLSKEFIVKIDAASSTPYLIVRPSETSILTFSYPDLVYAPNNIYRNSAHRHLI